MARSKARATGEGEGVSVFSGIVGTIVFVYLGLPIVVVILSSFTPTAFPEIPPSGFSLQWFQAVFQSAGWMRAIRTSLTLLVIVTPVTVALGTLAAYGLHRFQGRGVDLLQSFIMSPLMIPQIVLAIALLYLFAALGFSGSIVSMAAGQTVVALPYVVRCVNTSLASFDGRLEDASRSLGATSSMTFRWVVLPLVKPGIIAGALFAAVISVGEASISLFLSSPTTTPVSVRVFNYIEQTFDPAVTAVSAIFVIVSAIVLVAIDKTVGITNAL